MVEEMKIESALAVLPGNGGFELSTRMVISMDKVIRESELILRSIAEGFREFIKTDKGPELYEIYRPFIEEEIKRAIRIHVAELVREKSTEIINSINLKGVANIAAIQCGKDLGKELK